MKITKIIPGMKIKKVINRKTKTKSCIACNSKLEIINEILYDGVWCTSYGNFGSKEFDPCCIDNFLEFVVCDECLKNKKKRYIIHNNR